MNNVLENIYNETKIEETLNEYLRLMKMQEGDTFVGAQGNFYMIDPFAIMYFTKDGNSIHPSVKRYCQEALDYWNSVKFNYGHLYFIPPYIRETAQCNRLVRITRNFVKDNPNIPNSDKVIEFYKLEEDPKAARIDDKVYEDVGKVYQLNTKVKDEKNGAFGPANWNTTSTGMNPDKKPNVGLASPSTTIDWGSHGENAYNILISMSKDLNNKKSNLIKEEKETYAYKYIYLLLDYIINNPTEAAEIVSDIKEHKNNKSGNKKGTGRFGSEYRHTRFTAQPRNSDYWKDTIIGDINNLDDIANGDDEDWKKTRQELKGVFDRDTVNSNTEKVYNIKHLPKDLLGIEDDDTRYDARVYEDPMRKKVKGVAGYDIYRLEKERDSLADEIADIDEELYNTSVDSPDAKKLLRKKDELQKSYDNLNNRIESTEEEGQGSYRNNLSSKNKEKFSNVSKDNDTDILKDIKPERVYGFIRSSPNFGSLASSMLLL